MKASSFIAALKLVAHAKGKNDVRWYLNTVKFEFKGERLTLIATDGHRMAWAEIEAQGMPDMECLVSGGDIDALLKTIKPSEYTVEFIGGQETALTVRAGSTQAYCNLVDGKYPEWRRVSRDGADLVAVAKIGVNGDYLADALKHCAKYSGGRYGGTVVKFHGEHDAMRVEPAPLPAGCTHAAVVVMPMRT